MTKEAALTAVALVIFGYVVGSLSPSVFLGKLLCGKDLRQFGSGNPGTTNAFRVLGTRVGIMVLVADILKGVVPVVVARVVLADEPQAPLFTVAVALACVLGHNYSLFLRGRGGKGVATGAGAALGMMPVPMCILIVIYVLLLVTTRIVSVASITCTVLFPVVAVVFKEPLPYVVAACLMAALVLWAHRGNMQRLWRHTEPRVRFPWNKPQA